MTTETIAKIRATHSTLKYRQQARQHALRGWKGNDKRRKAHIKRHRGKIVSEETRAKMRAANIGKKLSMKTRRKMSKSRMGLQNTLGMKFPYKPRASKYGGLDKRALSHFAGCHGRVAIGKVPRMHWPRTRKGYISFCKELGPKPTDGQKWSVGRKNHRKGYVPGNIFWQLYSDNVKEMRARV